MNRSFMNSILYGVSFNGVSLFLALNLCCLWFGVVFAQPSQPQSTLEKAHDAFWKAKYEIATSLYLELAQKEPQISDHDYNLGVAYAYQKQWGKAIFAFEQASDKTPSEIDFKENLQYARTQAIESALRNTNAQRLILPDEDDLKSSVLDVLPNLDLAIALCISLSAVLFWMSRKMMVKNTSLGRLFSFIVLLMAVLMGLLQFAKDQSEVGEKGIVLDHLSKLQKGPGGQYATEVLLSAGVKFGVQGEVDGWVRVALSNGMEGWVQRGKVGVIGRGY